MAKNHAAAVFALISLLALTAHFAIATLSNSNLAGSGHNLTALRVRDLDGHGPYSAAPLRESMVNRPKTSVVASVHDIAVVQANAPQTATAGSTIVVNSTIVNYGALTEHPVIQLIVNGTLAGQDSSITILPHSAASSQINWNTVNYLAGVYSLVVRVLPVQGEQALGNNVLPPIFVTLTTRPPETPSSSTQPAVGFSREIVLTIAITETLLLSLFVIGRRLTIPTLFKRAR